MKGQDVLFSHKSDNYITPKWLIDSLKSRLDIKLDACTTGQNPLNTPFFYSLDQDNNGLKLNWKTWTFCNPPYSQIESWVIKADLESYKGISSILLLPARTDTKWFHNFIYNRNNVDIEFIEGRLKFEGMDNSAPFPSMLVIFR